MVHGPEQHLVHRAERFIDGVGCALELVQQGRHGACPVEAGIFVDGLERTVINCLSSVCQLFDKYSIKKNDNGPYYI